MSAFANLIRASVDYAGLFPPAKLPLEQVVKNYHSYLENNRHEMLGRLVLPSAKLNEFKSLAQSTDVGLSHSWKISALVAPIELIEDELSSKALESSLDQISEFNQQAGAVSSVVDAIEIRTSSPETIQLAAELIPKEISVFFEIDWREDPTRSISAIATSNHTNLFAKIRTGGITEDLIPSPDRVAEFLLSCANQNVGLKATAGLHHPVRDHYRLTYEPDSPQGCMHGFINVFVAGCLAFANQANSVEQIKEVLECRSSDPFQLDDNQVRFGNLSVDAKTVAQIRNSKLISFGSCSFDEPTNELESLFALNQ